MTKTFITSVLIVFTTVSLQAGQPDGNPFKKLGYKADIATFSNNEEFHDQSRIVQIGSVWFNTETNEVVGLVQEKDTLVEFVPELISTSIDPHCEKYYSISPYAYCFNNPIKFIDPDGRDVWEINEDGKIVNRIKDETQDAFYMVDKDGSRTYTTNAEGEKIYNSIAFEYGTIESQRTIELSKIESYDAYEVRGDKNGTELFEFFSQNVTASPSMVEFSQAMTGIEGDKGLNFITTSHTRKVEKGMPHLLGKQLLHGYHIRELNHSHPISREPSPENVGNKSGDLLFKSDVLKQVNKRKLNEPLFFIYHVPTKTYIPY